MIEPQGPSSFCQPPDYVASIQDVASTRDAAGFYCEVEGCDAGPYASKGTLDRHARKHFETARWFCPGQDCKMTFTRGDKLRDHMLDGHGHEDDFACPNIGCGEIFTRDLLVIHVDSNYIWPRTSPTNHVIRTFDSWRKCPMPRCKYRQSSGPRRSEVNLSSLQKHHLEHHDMQGRRNFAGTLASRGFQFETCAFLCPLCSSNNMYATHAEVRDHIKKTHLPPIVCKRHDRLISCWTGCRWTLESSDELLSTLR